MIRQITFLITGIFISNSLFAQQSKRALFLGNSYTYVNNLPQMVADVAVSAGDTLTFDSYAPGGYTLQGHSGDAAAIGKIMLGNWDFVVLQEQSQLPSFPIGQVQTDVFPYAIILDSMINAANPCGETMFYMTWGRKNGDASNCAFWPPVCTYEGMDSLLHLRYMMMADNNNAVVSPVGAAWNYIRQNYPGIELYQSDESHPSVAGSYAAACCFYATIFRKSPLLITNDYSLPAIDAAAIRQAVKSVVYDSLATWHVGEYDPVADFNFTNSPGNTVVFNNLSNNATTYHWFFGDGDTSTATSPSHTYSTSGNFSVSLISTHCNFSDTLILQVNATTGIAENNNRDGISFYPNPVTNQLVIHSNKIDRITIADAIGKSYMPPYITDGRFTTVDFSAFDPGIYFVVITANGKLQVRKIVKQ